MAESGGGSPSTGGGGFSSGLDNGNGYTTSGIIIADVAFYTYPLSTMQITNHYNAITRPSPRQIRWRLGLSARGMVMKRWIGSLLVIAAPGAPAPAVRFRLPGMLIVRWLSSLLLLALLTIPALARAQITGDRSECRAEHQRH